MIYPLVMKIRLFKLRIQAKKRNQFTDLTVNAWYDSLSAPFGVFSPGAPASSDTDTGFERDLKVHLQHRTNFTLYHLRNIQLY